MRKHNKTKTIITALLTITFIGSQWTSGSASQPTVVDNGYSMVLDLGGKEQMEYSLSDYPGAFLIIEHAQEDNEEQGEQTGFKGSSYDYINKALYKIDELLGTTRDENGVPSGIAFDKGVTLYDALNNSTLLEIINKNNEMFKGITEETFTDIKNNWCVPYIAMPVYYGVLNGYEDGTLRPDDSITAGELAKVVATAYESDLQGGGALANADFNGAWYNNYYRQIAKAFTYESSNSMTRQYMENPIRRCEVAYILASISDDGTLDTYIKKAAAGDISQMEHLGDFKNIANDSDGTLAKDQEIMSKGWIPARYAGAMMFLQAKGIMVGDGYNIHPLANVSRAEVFKMVQETCKTTTTYKSGSFRGKEVAYVISTPSNPSNPGTSGQNQDAYLYQPDQILNPNAPAKYQYSINDFIGADSNYFRTQLMTGKESMNKQMINSEKAKPIIDDVAATVKFENGIVKFDLPDIGSPYHEVAAVLEVSYSDGRDGFVVNKDSSKESGHFEIDTKGADYSVILKVYVIGIDCNTSNSEYMARYSFLDNDIHVGDPIIVD